MQEPTLQISVTCPDCALESVSTIPIAVIAHGLLIGKNLRLHSTCHDRYWTATLIEREKLRNALALLNISMDASQSQPRAEELAFAD